MMTIHRLNRPWILFSLLFISLLLLFAPFTHHGSENRERLKGVIESVKISSKSDTYAGKGNGKGRIKQVVEEDNDWGEADKMREWELNRALQYEGTGSRIQAFIDKARSGQPFTVSVIGGSVSKGRGLSIPPNQNTNTSESFGAPTLYSKENLHVIIFDWLNATFPNPGNKFVNGAQGGIGAGYFGWCFREHIPEDSDLILIEQGINDLLDMEVISLYEHLVRGLLELPNKPAVINVETFTTLFSSLLSSSAFHQGVLNFYDVPSIAIRDVILPRILADPNKQMPRWFRTGSDVQLSDPKVKDYDGVPVDVMHISARGHALAASLVIRYLQSQIERSAPASYFRKTLSRFASSYIRKPPLRILDVPPTSLTGQFDPFQRDPKHVPVCRSENSARLHGKISSAEDDQIEGLAQSQGIQLSEGSHGWSKWNWAEKRYFLANEPGAILIFDFVISPPAKDEEESKESLLIAESDPIQEPIMNINDNDTVVIEENVVVEEQDDDDTSGEDSENDNHSEEGGRGRSRFEPLPLGARPGGPFNIHADTNKHLTGSRSSSTARRRRRSKISPSTNQQITSIPAKVTSTSESQNQSVSVVEREIMNVEKRQNRGSGGSILIAYQRAKSNFGSVQCWVDEDRIQGTRVDGYWELGKRNMGTVKEITSGLSPGKHTLYCELLKETLDPSGGHDFRLIAIMHD